MLSRQALRPTSADSPRTRARGGGDRHERSPSAGRPGNHTRRFSSTCARCSGPKGGPRLRTCKSPASDSFPSLSRTSSLFPKQFSNARNHFAIFLGRVESLFEFEFIKQGAVYSAYGFLVDDSLPRRLQYRAKFLVPHPLDNILDKFDILSWLRKHNFELLIGKSKNRVCTIISAIYYLNIFHFFVPDLPPPPGYTLTYPPPSVCTSQCGSP